MPALWVIAWVSFQQSSGFFFLLQLKEEPSKSSLKILVLRLRVDRLLGDLKSLSATPLQRGSVQPTLVMMEGYTRT
jgi:hypothetical protein